jgi:hypothetical protein
MQEVATGKYHGHSFGGLNGVPPTDEIGRSVLSVRRTDATITFILLRCRWSPIGTKRTSMDANPTSADTINFPRRGQA